MLFALDVVNNYSSGVMSTILNKHRIRFGALIYDSCDYESYAVERAMNMLLPSINQCTTTTTKKDNNRTVVAGVIGSASSIVSMAIADILRLAEVMKKEICRSRTSFLLIYVNRSTSNHQMTLPLLFYRQKEQNFS